MRPSDAPGLVQAFIETLEDRVEFCDWPAQKMHAHAWRNIADYLAGRRGTPLLTASRLALAEGGCVVGAALLGEREVGPTLDLLVMRSGFRRRGLADALVGAAAEREGFEAVTPALRFGW